MRLIDADDLIDRATNKDRKDLWLNTSKTTGELINYVAKQPTVRNLDSLTENDTLVFFFDLDQCDSVDDVSRWFQNCVQALPCNAILLPMYFDIEELDKDCVLKWIDDVKEAVENCYK